MRWFLVSALVVLGCGRLKGKDPVYPIEYEPRLVDAINRIEPALHYCDDMIASKIPNNTTQRPNCENGDTILFSAYYLSTTPSEAIKAALRRTVRDNGQPCRSEEYLRAEGENCGFSRDHMLGHLLASLFTRDVELTGRIWTYAYNNGYRVCPNSDNCFLTPGLLVTWGDVWEHIGRSRADDMKYDAVYSKAVEDGEFRTVSNTATGYQAHLVATRIYLKVLTGRLTVGQAQGAATLAQRYPENLWFRYLANLTNGGNPAEYRRITESLLPMMDGWTGDLSWDWIWQRDNIQETLPRAYGHDLVFLARKLLEVRGALQEGE